MATHVKVVAVLYIALGALNLLAAALFAFAMGLAGTIVGMSGDPDAAVAMPIIGITGTALVGFLLLLSIPTRFAYRTDCQALIQYIGQTSMMMFSVRLSRIAHATPASMTTMSATVSQIGKRDASTNPAAIAPISARELSTLSP